MLISMEPQVFSLFTVVDAPGLNGVYALYNHTTLIYYGKADGSGGLRSQLRQRLKIEDPCLKKAVFVQWEINLTPGQRLDELLREHFVLHGALPECNAPIDDDRTATVAPDGSTDESEG